jgi:patatin-like phospholipase/acyl hydrolase
LNGARHSLRVERFRFVLFSTGSPTSSASDVIAGGSAGSLSNIWLAIIVPQMTSG